MTLEGPLVAPCARKRCIVEPPVGRLCAGFGRASPVDSVIQLAAQLPPRSGSVPGARTARRRRGPRLDLLHVHHVLSCGLCRRAWRPSRFRVVLSAGDSSYKLLTRTRRMPRPPGIRVKLTYSGAGRGNWRECSAGPICGRPCARASSTLRARSASASLVAFSLRNSPKPGEMCPTFTCDSIILLHVLCMLCRILYISQIEEDRRNEPRPPGCLHFIKRPSPFLHMDNGRRFRETWISHDPSN